VGEFSLKFIDQVGNKYAEYGGTEAAAFREPAEDVNSLMFSRMLQDSKSNSINASAKVAPHVTHNAIVQEDR